MSLSERLRKARTEKLIEAGLLPRDHPTPLESEESEPVDVVVLPQQVIPHQVIPQQAAADEGRGLFAPITIEARPAGLHLVVTPVVDLTTRADDENSATCPTCHALGFEDMVDLVGHTVHYTCPNCSTMWQVHKPVVLAD